MTTLTLERPPIAEEQQTIPDDPYVYGWRDVPHILASGEITWKRIPLTQEDILHPRLGDFQVHTDLHQQLCTYLYYVLVAWLGATPGAVVLNDVRIGWGRQGPKPHAPDIAVIFNVRRRRNWSTFSTVAEGTKPALIMEVTSPSTRVVDLVKKMEEYARVGVPLYVIVDTHGEVLQILGYRLTPAGYVNLPLDEQGRLWLEPVALSLGAYQDTLAFYDEAGQPFENYTQTRARANREAQARAAEAQARAAEAQARAAAEARIRELEAELRRLRGQ
ncbi:MAG: Uma2 family endonuclease [Chloroflexota bacterium]